MASGRSGAGPWWGRFGGTAVGALTLGWPGGIGGFLAGIIVDRRLRLRPFSPSRWIHGNRSQSQRVELVSTFAVAGYVAKANGRVSEREIDEARRIMRELALSPEECRLAVRVFTRGKKAGFPLVSVVRRLRRRAGDDRAVVERFFDAQLRMAFAEGQPSERQLHVLQAVGASLQLSAREVDRRMSARSSRRRQSGASVSQLDDAYALLEVKGSARPEEIRRAYRRKIGRFHPDRLQGRGSPPDEIRHAAARTREIREAYDEIRRVRGF